LKFPKYFAVGLLSMAAAIVNTAPALADSGWTEYVYNSSGQALMPSEPASVNGNDVSIALSPGQFVALLTTTDPTLTGDLTSKTLTASITVSGDTGTFLEQNGGGCTPDNQYVRFYFTSPAGSGSGFPSPGQPSTPTAGSVPAGFYTQFWWSNPVHMDLTGDGAGQIQVAVGNATQWSDWNGQSADNPAVTALFEKATGRVQSVGLSFGGGCFFENGLTITGTGGTFESVFSES
jgi:hypothetical protein